LSTQLRAFPILRGVLLTPERCSNSSGQTIQRQVIFILAERLLNFFGINSRLAARKYKRDNQHNPVPEIEHESKRHCHYVRKQKLLQNKLYEKESVFFDAFAGAAVRRLTDAILVQDEYVSVGKPALAVSVVRRRRRRRLTDAILVQDEYVSVGKPALAVTVVRRRRRRRLTDAILGSGRVRERR
jgi:hypothetical protein